MFHKDVKALLQKSLKELPLLVAQKSLRHDIDDLAALLFAGMKLAVVADCNTEAALGGEVFRALKNCFGAVFILLPGVPVADNETVEFIRSESSTCDALVAVGGGTVNDVCKYAAFTDGKPYIVCPTAASMNGYLSANASITFDGYKKTVKAAMPKAVLCDLGVIAAAPVRLSKSGLGDCLARPTAQADWLLSHLLLGTAYDDTPFQLLREVEDILFDNAGGIAKRDPASIEVLLQTLLLSGLGMTIAGGSYPASQAEHMVAHAYGMMRKNSEFGVQSSVTLHGEEIGVTALAMARMQETTLHTAPALYAKTFPENDIDTLFGETVAKEAAVAYRSKMDVLPPARIMPRWDEIREKLAPVMFAPDKILAILKAAQAPHTPEMLGWNAADFGNALSHARYLRERFTFLDLQV